MASLSRAARDITAGGISSYVHEGDHVLLARVTIPRGVARGTPIEVTADASTELHLVPGTELFLLIKTTAVTLYEDPT